MIYVCFFILIGVADGFVAFFIICFGFWCIQSVNLFETLKFCWNFTCACKQEKKRNPIYLHKYNSLIDRKRPRKVKSSSLRNYQKKNCELFIYDYIQEEKKERIVNGITKVKPWIWLNQFSDEDDDDLLFVILENCCRRKRKKEMSMIKLVKNEINAKIFIWQFWIFKLKSVCSGRFVVKSVTVCFFNSARKTTTTTKRIL